MRALIAELPDQLGWAAEQPAPALGEFPAAVVAGMGGSGFAGDVAAVFAADQGARVTVHKGYGLPGWTGDELVVAVSHSGNTEETRSAVTAAASSGVAAIGVSTGGALATEAPSHFPIPPGPQPRAAAGYLAGAVLRILEGAGVVSGTRSGLEEAAGVTRSMLQGGVADEADAIATALVGRATIVYGGQGMPAVAAARWKTQINENAKAPAWWSPLPELDHNEIVGWTAFPRVGADCLGVVFLHDGADHPRIAQRARLTAELMDGVHMAGKVGSRGDGILARLFSLVLVGDLVSVSLADKAGVDPVPVHVIEDLKKRLEEEPA